MERRMEHNIAIVLSAGRGSRMHADRAKQYLDLCGRPVIAWSLQAFESFDEVDDVILVTGSEDIEYCRSEIVEKYGIRKVRSIVPGGAERYLSECEGKILIRGEGSTNRQLRISSNKYTFHNRG